MSNRRTNGQAWAATGPGVRPRLLLVGPLDEGKTGLAEGLRLRGFEVRGVTSATDAVALLAEHAFDAVIVEATGSVGADVLAHVRASCSDLELPVVATGGPETAALEAMAMGASDHLSQPVDLDIAAARIGRALERRHFFGDTVRAGERLEVELREVRAALVRAEASAQARSDVLANMSHEIRTPLNGILGLAKAIAEGAAKDPIAAASVIAESARSLERLLSEALDLSKMEAGKLDIRHEPVQLDACVERIAALFAAGAEAKGLAFKVQIDPQAATWVRADPLRLQQVLGNLLSNAVKFTEAGSVTLAVRRENAALVSFEVRDTGVGFSADQAEGLFRRFEQADGAIAGRYGGTGLGLAIARNIAELMGGMLTASARPGGGAAFRLQLPLIPIAAIDAPSAGLAADPEPRDREQPARVLIADDHATNRQLLEILLQPLGADLRLVTDGAQALEAFAAGGFDLVLIDLEMPVLDGLSAIAAMRRRETEQRWPRTPIVALSGHALEEHVRRSQAAGADRHLTKPIHSGLLISTVAEMLAGEPSAGLTAQAAG